MKLVAKGILLLTALSALAATAWTQTDRFGKLDTVYADLAMINQYTWSITISYTNDEDIEALSVPLKMSAGMTKIVADSAAYTGGRVVDFTFKGFRPDTAIQCVTLGMMANVGPTSKYLPRGSGRLVTVFVSSVDKKPIEKFMVDTTTTQPNNYLMVVASKYQYGATVDTIPQAKNRDREILPAFLVRYPK
jgi:hypothetical protein